MKEHLQDFPSHSTNNELYFASIKLIIIFKTQGFFGGSNGKEFTCKARDTGNGSVSGLVRSPGEGNGYPLQYSGLENSMDYIVHGVTKSWTRLSDFHFTSLHFTFCYKSGIICISEVVVISPGNPGSSLLFIKAGILHDVLCI